jgi:hypothetical protein
VGAGGANEDVGQDVESEAAGSGDRLICQRGGLNSRPGELHGVGETELGPAQLKVGPGLQPERPGFPQRSGRKTAQELVAAERDEGVQLRGDQASLVGKGNPPPERVGSLVVAAEQIQRLSEHVQAGARVRGVILCQRLPAGGVS